MKHYFEVTLKFSYDAEDGVNSKQEAIQRAIDEINTQGVDNLYFGVEQINL